MWRLESSFLPFQSPATEVWRGSIPTVKRWKHHFLALCQYPSLEITSFMRWVNQRLSGCISRPFIRPGTALVGKKCRKSEEWGQSCIMVDSFSWYLWVHYMQGRRRSSKPGAFQYTASLTKQTTRTRKDKTQWVLCPSINHESTFEPRRVPQPLSSCLDVNSCILSLMNFNVHAPIFRILYEVSSLRWIFFIA